MPILGRKSWPLFSRCAEETENPHRGFISGRHHSSAKVSLLRPSSYANAESWDDLVYVLTTSLRNSSLDEMILLLHIDIPDQYEWRPNYVRLVAYRRLDDVPKLLTGALPALTLTSGATFTRQQRPRVEVATGARPDGDHEVQDQQKHIDDMPQEEGVAEGKEAEAIASSGDHEEEIDETQANAAKVIQDAYRRHWERKRTPAVRKIQAAYRRHLKRKSVVRKGIDENQSQYWQLLRQRSMEMEWSKDSQYYLLFRVPLAYILVCLDAIKTFIESENKVAKKRLMTEDHKALDDVMKALTQYKYDTVDCALYSVSNKFSRKLRKETIELQKKLSPSSPFHEKRSVSDLQRAVAEVKVVMESLYTIPGSVGLKKKIQKRWDRGWKWIFEKERSGVKGKKAEKPKLVLEDPLCL